MWGLPQRVKWKFAQLLSINLMRKIFFLSIFLAFCSALKGQYFEEEQPEIALPGLSVKLIPSTMIWHFPAYSASVQHRLLKDFSMEYKFGVVFDTYYFNEDDIYYANKGGFKSSVMFQIPVFKRENHLSYFGIEPFYNSVNFDRTRIFEISCGFNCSYFTEATYGIDREDAGARINYGTLYYISKVVFVELSFGLGAQVSTFTPDDRKPVDFMFEYGKSGLSENERRSAISADLGLKLGFVILK